MLLSQYNEYYFTLLCIGILLRSHILPRQNFGVSKSHVKTHGIPDSKVYGANMGPYCQPQMGPMLALWTLFSGIISCMHGRIMDVVGTVQERHNSIHNSIAIALELHLSCTKLSIWVWKLQLHLSGPTWTTRTPAFWDTPAAHLKNKTSKLQILKNCQKLKFWNFARNLTYTDLLKLLDKMFKYEMDPTRTVGATDAGRMDGQTDGGTNAWSETNIPPPPTTSLLWVDVIYDFYVTLMHDAFLVQHKPPLACDTSLKHVASSKTDVQRRWHIIGWTEVALMSRWR